MGRPLRPDMIAPHALDLCDHGNDDLGAVIAVAFAMGDSDRGSAQGFRSTDMGSVPGLTGHDRSAAEIAEGKLPPSAAGFVEGEASASAGHSVLPVALATAAR